MVWARSVPNYVLRTLIFQWMPRQAASAMQRCCSTGFRRAAAEGFRREACGGCEDSREVEELETGGMCQAGA